MRPARIIALVLGCLLFIPALALLFGGSALGLGYAFGRGDDGYFDTTIDRLATDAVAITAEDITFASDPGSPDWILDALDADVRLRATNGDAERQIFIGIARESDVDAYLDGIAHDEISDVTDDLEPIYRERTGGNLVAPPTGEDFWAVSATGPGTQELEWEAATGRWAAVLMNADGSPGVSADVNVGAKAAFVLPLLLIMLGAGAFLTVASVGLIVLGAHGASRTGEPGAPTLGADEALRLDAANPVHPVTLAARLDPELSRWKWLVKWILAIPHFIVLAFLWLAFVVLTIVAAVAIVVTGRYPQRIFDFNVGVLRWSWRVSFYATNGGIGTDRYPPFGLHAQAGDQAHLEVVYPEQLSRGLVFVKWLLAIPHLIIVGLLAGSSVRWFGFGGDRVGIDAGGGLLGILVIVAGVALLFTGRYPQALFDLIIGLNRWVYRTVAYVALMTDDYPPFRLDQGGDEPPGPSAPTEPPDSGGTVVLDLAPPPGPLVDA